MISNLGQDSVSQISGLEDMGFRVQGLGSRPGFGISGFGVGGYGVQVQGGGDRDQGRLLCKKYLIEKRPSTSPQKRTRSLGSGMDGRTRLPTC
jgi:hypothetical protein